MATVKYPIPINGIFDHSKFNQRVIFEHEHQFRNTFSPFHMRKRKLYVKTPKRVISAPASVINGFLSSPSNYGSTFIYEDDMQESANNYFSVLRYAGQHPFAALKKMYAQIVFQLNPGRFNLKAETTSQHSLHLDLMFASIAWFTAIMLSLELFFKVVGGLLSQPTHFFLKYATNALVDDVGHLVDTSPGIRILAGIGSLISFFIFWLPSQIAFTLGNVANASRKIVDGFVSMCNSALSFLNDGLQKKLHGHTPDWIFRPTYGVIYPEIHHPIGSMIKNLLLLIGAVPVLGTAIDWILAQTIPPLKQLFGDVASPMPTAQNQKNEKYSNSQKPGNHPIHQNTLEMATLSQNKNTTTLSPTPSFSISIAETVAGDLTFNPDSAISPKLGTLIEETDATGDEIKSFEANKRGSKASIHLFLQQTAVQDSVLSDNKSSEEQAVFYPRKSSTSRNRESTHLFFQARETIPAITPHEADGETSKALPTSYFG